MLRVSQKLTRINLKPNTARCEGKYFWFFISSQKLLSITSKM